MSRKITVMLIPEKGNKRLTFTFSYLNWRFIALLGFLLSLIASYLCFDYSNLVLQRRLYYQIQKENRMIKSEAQVLSQNLESLKESLQHVQDYARKVSEIVNIKMNTVKNKTGIGPLSDDEIKSVKFLEESGKTYTSFPFGIDLKKLNFSPIFSNLNEIQEESNTRAEELRELLDSLNQKKALLSSIPTSSPVKGWISSGFGKRLSPFTGYTAEHRGIDIAAAIGTPIYTPADGIVIFSGMKATFGNLVMIAHHNNGIVTKYAHNAENLVAVGQQVSRGEQIASVGMTGNTTGPHVHYEVWVHGQPENPSKFILDAEIGLF